MHEPSPEALYLFNEGRHFQIYDMLGAHLLGAGAGTAFAVWAPNARAVSVVHDGNGWTEGADQLHPQGGSGVWAGTLPGLLEGTRYKYCIVPRSGAPRYKADPVGFGTEVPPLTASVVRDLSYDWGDTDWLERRSAAAPDAEPISIYEVHLGSWRRGPDHRFLSYQEIAEPLTDHVRK